MILLCFPVCASHTHTQHVIIELKHVPALTKASQQALTQEMWQSSGNQPSSHLFRSPHHLDPLAHEAEFLKLGKEEEEEEEVALDELMVPGDKVAPGYFFGGMSQVLD